MSGTLSPPTRRWYVPLCLASGLISLAISPNTVLADVTNLVSNGNFETPSAGSTFTEYRTGTNLGGWAVTGDSVDLLGIKYQAASGIQSLDLCGVAAGAVYQDLATVPGQGYVLTFAMAGNTDGSPVVKQLRVNWGDVAVDTPSFDTTGHNVSNMGWTYRSYDVVAASSVTRLTFTSLTAGMFGPAIDNVSVTVPEPSSLVLLALAAPMLFRRRRSQ